MPAVSIKIKTYCEERGLRCPVKKLLVADYLEQADDFIEAGALYLFMRNARESVSSATVYQSLNWLIENKFAELETKDSRTRYRISNNINGDPTRTKDTKFYEEQTYR